MNDNILMETAIAFAAKIMKLSDRLAEGKSGFALSAELTGCAGAIGAGISRAAYARSREDYIARLRAALEDAAEAEYWIKLLLSAEYIEAETQSELLEDCTEVKRRIIAAINSAREK